MIDNIKFWKGSDVIGPAIANFDAASRDWALVYFQPEQPVLEGELNLIQQASNLRLRDLLRSIYPEGGVIKSLVPTATGVANEIRLHTADETFYVVLDGIMKPVFGYDDPASAGAVVGGNRVTLPAHAGGTYTELVFLEVWFEEVMGSSGGAGTTYTASTDVYQWGMVGNFDHDNDIRVPSVPLAETTRRIQTRGQLRVVTAANLTGVLAKGVIGYGYGLVANTNFYRTGAGTSADGEALNTVDGYVYAIPLVSINRNAPIVAQPDISYATDIIPTGSDMVSDFTNLLARMDALEGMNYWHEGNRRSDADDDARFLRQSLNLSDVASVPLARANLGITDAATWPTTDSRTDPSPTTLLQAKGMDDHRVSNDHNWLYYTQAQVDAMLAGDFTPGDHTHIIADVTGLQAALDGKAPTSHTHDAADVISGVLNIGRIPTGTSGTTVALGNHTHVGYATASHTHDASDVVSGILPVARGGTGKGSIGGTNYIRGDGSGGYVERTYAQVRTDIGAAATSHTHEGLYPGVGIFGGTYNTGSTQEWQISKIPSGNASVGAVWYNGTTREDGHFYGGATVPSASSGLLNFQGRLYATSLYASSHAQAPYILTDRIQPSGSSLGTFPHILLSSSEISLNVRTAFDGPQFKLWNNGALSMIDMQHVDRYKMDYVGEALLQADSVYITVKTISSSPNTYFSGTGQLYQVTSSRRYKTDITDVTTEDAHRVLNLRPVTYRPVEDEGTQYFGLIAEEVAEVDPRLVIWDYAPEDYDRGDKTLKPGAQIEPRGVQYERVGVLLIDVVRELSDTISNLKQRIETLEAAVGA